MAVVCLVAAVAVAACGSGAWTRPLVGIPCADCAAGLAIQSRVVLIGDAGEDLPDNPVLDVLEALGAETPGRTIALFLGDNIYPRGLPAASEDAGEERATAERILGHQIRAAAAAGAEAIFIPGNHDWNKSQAGGLARVRAQATFVDAAGDPAIRVQPRNGCPGPVVLDRGDTLRIVVVDTEWLLTDEHARGESGCTWGAEGAGRPLALPSVASRPGVAPAQRPESDRFERGNAVVYDALRSVVGDAGDRHVVVAAHHPLRTNGSHGGHVGVRDFFFPLTLFKKWLFVPLPVLYPALRYTVVRHDQDLFGRRNRAMVAGLEGALAGAEARSIAVASGHEHTLQVLRDPDLPVLHLVSGAGAKTDAVGVGDDTLFKHGALGLMVIDVLADGRALLRVIEASASAPTHVAFAMWLEG